MNSTFMWTILYMSILGSSHNINLKNKHVIVVYQTVDCVRPAPRISWNLLSTLFIGKNKLVLGSLLSLELLV